MPESASVGSPAPQLRLGDHLLSPRRFITHHGIYAGNGQVIHYAGLASGLQATLSKSRPWQTSWLTIPTRSGSTRRGSTQGKNALRGHGHASGRMSITRLSITVSTLWLGASPGIKEARRLTCSSDLLEAPGVSFSAARGRRCMRFTEGYAPISGDRRTGFGFADNETSVVSSRGFLATAQRGDPGAKAGGDATRGNAKRDADRRAHEIPVGALARALAAAGERDMHGGGSPGATTRGADIANYAIVSKAHPLRFLETSGRIGSAMDRAAPVWSHPGASQKAPKRQIYCSNFVTKIIVCITMHSARVPSRKQNVKKM